jgi:hypothetical protein
MLERPSLSYLTQYDSVGDGNSILNVAWEFSQLILFVLSRIALTSVISKS